MKKQKVRLVSLRVKIAVPLILMVMTACIGIGMTCYNIFSEYMHVMGSNQAVLAAQMSLRSININMVTSLKPGDDEGNTYRTYLELLRDSRDACGVAYLYTLYTDGEKVYYGIDTDETNEHAPIGEEFEVPLKDLKAVFNGEVQVDKEISVDEASGINIMSAYIPLVNTSGEVAGILGCDYNADHIISGIQDMLNRIAMLGLGSIVISVFLIIILVENIRKNITKINNKLYELTTSNGDLTKRIDNRSGDEIELIANNLNAVLEYIRQVMLSIRDSSNRLNDSALQIEQHAKNTENDLTDISATMEEMSASTQETTASLSQIDEAVNTMADAVNQIAEFALKGVGDSKVIMDKANEIKERAFDSQVEVADSAVTIVEEVRGYIENSKEVNKISKLSETIIGITKQTNLLALNAAIEAARAGEAGRGFSVVADEIGKLATTSAETANEIKEVSTEVVKAVEELAESTEKIITFLDEVGMQGYNELIETSDTYHDDISAMSEAMANFNKASEHIQNLMIDVKESVNAIALTMEENARGVQGVTESTVEITATMQSVSNEMIENTHLVADLNNEVAKFKIDDDTDKKGN